MAKFIASDGLAMGLWGDFNPVLNMLGKLWIPLVLERCSYRICY